MPSRRLRLQQIPFRKKLAYLRSLSHRLTVKAQMRIIHEPTEDTIRAAKELWAQIQVSCSNASYKPN